MSTEEKLRRCYFYWGGTNKVLDFYEDTELKVRAAFYTLFLNLVYTNHCVI